MSAYSIIHEKPAGGKPRQSPNRIKDTRVPNGRLTGRYPLPARSNGRHTNKRSAVVAAGLTAVVWGLTGIFVRLLSTNSLSSSDCHCLVQDNSNQPAAKSAFLLEFWEILRGPGAAILDCLFRAFTARKNSTRYEAQQTTIAREPSIELCRAFLQGCPRCSRFVEPTRIEHHSCRHRVLRISLPLRLSRPLDRANESSRRGMGVWHTPHRNSS